MNKSGRPKSANSANNQYRIRLTDEDLRKLNECAKYYNIPKSDIIRNGISILYNKIGE